MISHLILSQLALEQYGLSIIKTLYDEEGSAEGVLKKLGKSFTNEEQRAKEEMAWCEQNNVRILTISDADYPDRLRHCNDAPMVLFTRGKADLNALTCTYYTDYVWSIEVCSSPVARQTSMLHT